MILCIEGDFGIQAGYTKKIWHIVKLLVNVPPWLDPGNMIFGVIFHYYFTNAHS